MWRTGKVCLDDSVACPKLLPSSRSPIARKEKITGIGHKYSIQWTHINIGVKLHLQSNNDSVKDLLFWWDNCGHCVALFACMKYEWPTKHCANCVYERNQGHHLQRIHQTIQFLFFLFHFFRRIHSTSNGNFLYSIWPYCDVHDVPDGDVNAEILNEWISGLSKWRHIVTIEWVGCVCISTDSRRTTV